jgi:hypothetical protein
MTAAYLYARDGLYSYEIERLKRIDRFGIEAVTGRKVFLFSDFIRMLNAENVVHAYVSRKNASNWTEWAASNPQQAELLFEIEKTLDSGE